MWAFWYLQLFTVQKLEELRESGAAPYSDTHCVDVSLVSTSLVWSDQTAPQLHPLQLLLLECICLLSRTHNANYNKPTHTLQISSLCMLLHIILVCWVGILLSNKWPFAITCSEYGGVGVFWGWAYFRETTVLLTYYIPHCSKLKENHCVTWDDILLHPVSSPPSVQSWVPSQRSVDRMHCPLLHRNAPLLQVAAIKLTG